MDALWNFKWGWWHFFLQYINNTNAFKFGENVFGIRERTNGWFVKRKCMHVCTYIHNLHVDFASWCWCVCNIYVMPALLFSPQQSTTNQIYLSDIFLKKKISEKNDIVILKADISSISCMYFIYHFPPERNSMKNNSTIRHHPNSCRYYIL